jgi:hypothetical protein
VIGRLLAPGDFGIAARPGFWPAAATSHQARSQESADVEDHPPRDSHDGRRLMGTVYRQKGRTAWMIKYYRNGALIYESSGTEIKDQATALLKKREGAIADGRHVSNQTGKLLFETAAADVVHDYQINGKRSIDNLNLRQRLNSRWNTGTRVTAPTIRATTRTYPARRSPPRVRPRCARGIPFR